MACRIPFMFCCIDNYGNYKNDSSSFWGTALIAATQADIRALGWYYVPVVMLSSVLMMAVGLITNNIQRQYPMYWWTSGSLGPQEDVVKKVVVAELSEGYESELTVRDVEK